MKDLTLADKNFPHLKGFAAFLLENHLQEVAEINIALARQVDLSLIKLFTHLSEPDFLSFMKGNLQLFLNQVLEQNALEFSKESLHKWKMDTLSHIPRSGIAIADLVQGYHVRQQALLEFVGRYTSDVNTAVAVARELNLFYAEVEQYAFSLYVDLKQEEHQDINEKLQEQFVQLIASQDELRQKNEKLEQQAKVQIATEQALEKERNFLNAILEHIDDGIVACDEHGVLSFFNKATREFHGISEEALSAEQWSSHYNLYHADALTPLAKEEVPLFRAYHEGFVERVEIVIAPVSGKKRMLLVKGQAILSSEGKKLGAVVVMHDVTELKLAQQQQQEAFIELHEKNKALAAALEELQTAEEQLKEANDQLQARVERRTQELVASEQQMRAITNALPVLITYVDAEERYRFINNTYKDWFGLALADVYGKKLEEVYGEQMGEIMGPAAYDRVKSNVQRVLKGERLQYETTLYTIEGEKYVLIDYIPYKVEEQVLGYFALTTDLTRRRQAKEALLESEERFRSFANNIQNLAWMADPDGWIFWYNQRWYDYTGTTFEEMQGWGWEKVHHPDYIEGILAFMKEAWHKGETLELTFPLRRADGEYGWFITRAYAIKNAEGEIVRWIGTNTDITEQKKAQEQLQKANQEITDLLVREKIAFDMAEASRSRLYNTFMQAPSLLCIVRGFGLVYELANPRYLEAFNLDFSVEGKRIDEVFPNPDPSIIAIHHNVLTNGEPFIGNELPVFSDWKRNNEPYTRYFNVRYEPLREADGSISGIIAFGYEVSEHVKTRQALEQNASLMQEMNLELSQKNTELEKINNDLDNFIYTASHDLRSPIVNLEGLVLALKHQLKSANGKNPDVLLGMMDTSIAKLQRTILDLTEITKAQKGLTEAKEEVSVTEILDDVKQDLQQSIEQANARIQEDLQAHNIHFARRNLRSILHNLLSNAIKYRAEERPLQIEVKTNREDGFFVLSVQDNGLGINEQQIPKMFTMFKRLHTHVEGTGIGLYIVKRIVENNRGKIEVSSKPGVGTTFKVYISSDK